jgi:hypothetical protein
MTAAGVARVVGPNGRRTHPLALAAADRPEQPGTQMSSQRSEIANIVSGVTGHGETRSAARFGTGADSDAERAL